MRPEPHFSKGMAGKQFAIARGLAGKAALSGASSVWVAGLIDLQVGLICKPPTGPARTAFHLGDKTKPARTV
jgi:hypothetical protein